jgi:hypothetical protein
MNKVMWLGLAALLCAAAAVHGTEDAIVMPGRVGRVYMVPSYVGMPGYFNSDGEYKEYKEGEGAKRVFNLAFALEYGVNDWITAALQWTPAVNVWSEVDRDISAPPPAGFGSSSDINLNDVYDLFVGAKVQIIGKKAPVQNDMFRLSVAPGVKIPLPGPDYEEQLKNIGKGDPVTMVNADKHVLGVGGRLWVDYYSENIYAFLYNELIAFPVKGKISESGLQERFTLEMFNATAGAMGVKQKDEVDYGFDYNLIFEPGYIFNNLGPGNLTISMPLDYTFYPGRKYGGLEGSAAALAMVPSQFPDEDPSNRLNLNPALGYKIVNDALSAEFKLNFLARVYDSNEEYLHHIKPEVNLFFTSWALPTEFLIRYELPVAGQAPENRSVDAQHLFSVEVRLYFKI